MVPWEEVVLELREFVRDHLNSGKAVVTELDAVSGLGDDGFSTREVHAEPSSDLEEQIIAILDNEIAPAVARDGGNITFKAFNEGVVNVVLRGACSGCPSSTVTLKNGIETLLKNRLPGEVTEVVAING